MAGNMASAQITDEQLQQSAVLSDDDAEFENASEVPPVEEAPMSTESPLTNPIIHDDVLSDATPDRDEERDGSVAENGLELGDNTDEHSELSDDSSDVDDEMDHNFGEDLDPCAEQNHGDEGSVGADSRSSSPLDNVEEDEEAEGVGAVKIRPGETDEEADLESDNSDSQSESQNESDGAAAWEAAAGEDEDDEEGSEDIAPNTCMFCKQDEENDPGEEFEEYLTCGGCGENCKCTRLAMERDPELTLYLAHQHCAREASAMKDPSSRLRWKCPECAIGHESAIEPVDEVFHGPEPEPEVGLDVELSPSSWRSTASQMARDLLPPQKGPTKPDSHSVFNQLVLDGDPMDGSRVLRKRKTSSVEADDMVMSLRKRRRNNSKERESFHGAGISQDAADGAGGKDVRRKLRLNHSRKTQVIIMTRRQRSIIVKMRVKPYALRRVLSRKSISNRKRSERGNIATSRGDLAASVSTSFTSDYSYPFYSFFERETDEMKAKPYGGILSEAEADTSRTLPTNDDRRKFDEAKQKAEEIWRARLHSAQANLGTLAKRPKKNAGPASQIECIDFGGWEIDTWYAAPYPEEYSRNRTLYICEFCLKYMNSDYVAWRHKLKCPAKHPPGDEIYRHGSVSVFEVDGRKNPVYCQNLCLLAKLFLGSKTLYYDVEPFLFYVLCEYDALGYHFVGYFSKEKRASSQNNVSCILTLPIHQRKGYGNLLIDFSYLLTRVERKTGSPEKPLSDMGLVSYRNYWRLVLCRYLLDHIIENKAASPGLSIRHISDDTGLTADDVISALEGLRCLVRDPQTELYAFRVDLAYCSEYISKWERKNYIKLNPEALTWTPYVMGRGNATNFELGPAISAIAPRDEDDAHKPVEESVSVTSHHETVANSAPANGVVGESTAIESAPLTDADGVEEDDNTNSIQVHPDTSKSMESHDGVVNRANSLEAAHKEASQEGMATQYNSGQLLLDDWTLQYKDVPPSRFEVYPPHGGRRSDRPRPSVSRPAVPRSNSGISRPKRSSGGGSSARRPSSSRPKSSSSSRRKTGGTGRGPGRWPKGTKKSDYGNADSGPGLPPAWIRERARLAAIGGAKVSDAGEGSAAETKDTMDVVRVQLEAVTVAGGNVGGGNNGGDGHAKDEGMP